MSNNDNENATAVNAEDNGGGGEDDNDEDDGDISREGPRTRAKERKGPHESGSSSDGGVTPYRPANLFTLTDDIAKRLREILFETRKAVAVLVKLYQAERGHSQVLIQGFTKGIEPSGSSSWRTPSPSPLPSTTTTTTTPTGASSSSSSSSASQSPFSSFAEAQGPLQALGGLWDSLLKQAQERQNMAKTVLRKGVLPLRKQISNAIGMYNKVVKKHSQCAKTLKDKRSRMEALRATTLRLVRQCDQETKAAQGIVSQHHNESLLGRLTGIVLGSADLRALQGNVVTVYKAYLSSLEELNKCAHIAVEKQLPVICKEYEMVGRRMAETLSAHLNVIASLVHRSNTVNAQTSKAIESTLETSSKKISEFVETTLKCVPGSKGFRKVSFENTLQVTLEDVMNNVYHHSPKAKPLAIACEILGKSSIFETGQLLSLLRCLPNRYHMRDWKLGYSMNSDGASLDRLASALRNDRGKIVIVRTSKGERFGFFTASPLINSDAYYGPRESLVFRLSTKNDRKRAVVGKALASSASSAASSSSKRTTGRRTQDPVRVGRALSSSSATRTQTTHKRSLSSPSRDEAKRARATVETSRPTYPQDVLAEKEGVEVWRWTGNNDCILLKTESSLTVGGSEPAIHLDKYLKDGTSGRCSTFGSPGLSEGGEFLVHAAEAWQEVE
mmetsp:Transcript_31341/g.76454  ORF Transcript_31341/g.76454 Transcript_31341/m.76454 type:complete len:672 (+) Transcript_31341:146-2161(+)|eukprot:CAMPEP_0114490078 /NCGR_PEP_ID=MMETSP0109-20121206/2238_1 /TAXON_ID=29199 /ORGANISM="Chlorarachnion reptans, Strain CCCM449" /LENGTH=671 /DNA_ID=CAMNT_0001666647 /DNA_START=56 /DNA_END=2071 /DNA_ORIENTATION=+